MKTAYKIDIHGLKENDAYCTLLEFFNALPPGAGKVVVVHGFHGGTVLKTMVKNFCHYRIDYIIEPLHNQGETYIFTKP